MVYIGPTKKKRRRRKKRKKKGKPYSIGVIKKPNGQGRISYPPPLFEDPSVLLGLVGGSRRNNSSSCLQFFFFDTLHIGLVQKVDNL
jgi:hypothetical protein